MKAGLDDGEAKEVQDVGLAMGKVARRPDKHVEEVVMEEDRWKRVFKDGSTRGDSEMAEIEARLGCDDVSSDLEGDLYALYRVFRRTRFCLRNGGPDGRRQLVEVRWSCKGPHGGRSHVSRIRRTVVARHAELRLLADLCKSRSCIIGHAATVPPNLSRALSDRHFYNWILLDLTQRCYDELQIRTLSQPCQDPNPRHLSVRSIR